MKFNEIDKTVVNEIAPLVGMGIAAGARLAAPYIARGIQAIGSRLGGNAAKTGAQTAARADPPFAAAQVGAQTGARSSPQVPALFQPKGGVQPAAQGQPAAAQGQQTAALLKPPPQPAVWKNARDPSAPASTGPKVSAQQTRYDPNNPMTWGGKDDPFKNLGAGARDSIPTDTGGSIAGKLGPIAAGTAATLGGLGLMAAGGSSQPQTKSIGGAGQGAASPAASSSAGGAAPVAQPGGTRNNRLPDQAPTITQAPVAATAPAATSAAPAARPAAPAATSAAPAATSAAPAARPAATAPDQSNAETRRLASATPPQPAAPKATPGPQQGVIGSQLAAASNGLFRTRADRLDQAKVNAVLGPGFTAGSAEANIALAKHFANNPAASGSGSPSGASPPPPVAIPTDADKGTVVSGSTASPNLQRSTGRNDSVTGNPIVTPGIAQADLDAAIRSVANLSPTSATPASTRSLSASPPAAPAAPPIDRSSVTGLPLPSTGVTSSPPVRPRTDNRPAVAVDSPPPLKFEPVKSDHSIDTKESLERLLQLAGRRKGY